MAPARFRQKRMAARPFYRHALGRCKSGSRSRTNRFLTTQPNPTSASAQELGSGIAVIPDMRPSAVKFSAQLLAVLSIHK